jgi:hypothetical protein
MEDDYGDKSISLGFYGGDISEDQKRVAKRTRNLIEKQVGRYSDLRKLVEAKNRRAITAFTRGLNLQWIRTHIQAAIKCPICKGLLDPGKSVSYDHKKPKREQGTGDRDNVEPAHPYCNNSRDSLLS